MSDNIYDRISPKRLDEKIFLEAKKVICVEKGSYRNLTVGKEYDVIGVTTTDLGNLCFKIIGDEGEPVTAFVERFKIIEPVYIGKKPYWYYNPLFV